MATGFAKWGMTGGTAAAMILADRLARGRDEPRRDVRPQPLRRCALGATRMVKENAVGAALVGDRVTKPGDRELEELEPGEGDIVSPRRREGRRLPRRGRQARRGLPELHASRLPGELELRRAELGLPLSRLALRDRGTCSRGRPCTGSSASRWRADGDLRRVPGTGGRRDAAGLLRALTAFERLPAWQGAVRSAACSSETSRDAARSSSTWSTRAQDRSLPAAPDLRRADRWPASTSAATSATSAASGASPGAARPHPGRARPPDRSRALRPRAPARRDRGRGDEARAARPRTRGREAWRFRLLIRPPPPS